MLGARKTEYKLMLDYHPGPAADCRSPEECFDEAKCSECVAYNKRVRISMSPSIAIKPAICAAAAQLDGTAKLLGAQEPGKADQGR